MPYLLFPQGLPFNVSFDYSFYTLSYVLLKGYGLVGSSSLSHAKSSLHDGSSSSAVTADLRQPQDAASRLETINAHSELDEQITSKRQLMRQLQSMNHALQNVGLAEGLDGHCPYQAVDLPLDSDVIALEPQMVRPPSTKSVDIYL
jgi:hypothetical protein